MNEATLNELDRLHAETMKVIDHDEDALYNAYPALRDEIRRLGAEVVELRKRRDGLLEANNRLVEERRAAAADAAMWALEHSMAEDFFCRVANKYNWSWEKVEDVLLLMDTVIAERDEAQRQVAVLREVADNAARGLGDDVDRPNVLTGQSDLVAALLDTTEAAEAYETRIRADERAKIANKLEAEGQPGCADMVRFRDVAEDHDAAS